MRRGALVFTAGMLVSLLISASAEAVTTSAFKASFKETFGRAPRSSPASISYAERAWSSATVSRRAR